MIHSPTDQQLSIFESTERHILIKAGPGSAKTTTLIELARRNPTEKMLYLAFNRSVKDAVNAIFGDNVTVMTLHGLAYASVGAKYKHKLSANLKNYDLLNKIDYSDIMTNPEIDQLKYQINGIKKALQAYFVSSDDTITLNHFNDSKNGKKSSKSYSSISLLKQCMAANKIWKSMCENSAADSISMTHDGYLKLYSLSDIAINYDRLLIDEAQDMNMVAVRLLNKVKSKKVIVGDENQSIYQFRGAINAMDILKSDKEYKLTRTFRFGSSVAGVANALLFYKGSDSFIINNGTNGKASFYANSYSNNSDHVSGFPAGGKIKEQYAYIANTSYSLFMHALEAISANKKIHFIGGVDEYKFSKLDDIYALKNGGLVQDPFIKLFKDYSKFVEYSASDQEYGSMVKLVEMLGIGFKTQLLKIQQAVSSQEDCDVILTTAHKAKGLEFDMVVLAADYLPLNVDLILKGLSDETRKEQEYQVKECRHYFNTKEKDEDWMQAINLLYVAVTRARKEIILPELFFKFLKNRTIIAGMISKEGMATKYNQKTTSGLNIARKARI